MVVKSLIYDSFQTVGGKEWLLDTTLLLTFNTVVAMCNFPVSLGYPNSWGAAGSRPVTSLGNPGLHCHLSLILSEMFSGFFLLA